MMSKLRDARIARARGMRAQRTLDFDAARKNVEDTAGVNAGLWLSYLFALFYISLAAGGVTHRDLLLENPVKLPFLSVEPPLVPFFVLAPILFVVFHAYTLAHFVILAGKVGKFKEDLQNNLPQPREHQARENLRWQLPSNMFVQFLAGPHEVRDGALGWLLKTIAWISLVISPVLLLLLIQVQFLPYHLESVTWLQRLALLADITLLWYLWPAVLQSRSALSWPPLRHHKFAAVVSLILVSLSFIAATFPGEWLDEHVGKKQWIPLLASVTQLKPMNPPGPTLTPFGASVFHVGSSIKLWRWTSIHDLLFNGQVDEITRRRKSLFSNTLVLSGFDALEAAKIDPEKLNDGSVKYSLVLRGRHLEDAVFAFADLRKIDFTGSNLQGSSFLDSKLQGAFLDNAQLQGALMSTAQLQGASFAFAELQGANLAFAQLQGANLAFSQLQGASLYGAHLEGASFTGAKLQGVWLDRAKIQGASLEAQLQGSSLTEAELDGASLDGAFLWRANLRDASIGTIRNNGIVWDSKWSFGTGIVEWTQADYDELRAKLENVVPPGQIRDLALGRIETLDPSKIINNDTSPLSSRLEVVTTSDDYETKLVKELLSLVCSSGLDASYIVHGIVANGRVLQTGSQAAGLFEAITNPKGPENCPVSLILTSEEKAALKGAVDDVAKIQVRR
jgi:uncharacterized protein YjbI with pentapeptide repeats